VGTYRRRDSNVWWISYLKDGHQHRESTGSTNKKVAEKILISRKAQVVEERWNAQITFASPWRVCEEIPENQDS
jgi:hypothetical protein